MQRYGQGSQDAVESAMHRRKKGTLKSGKSGKTVKSRKQAIAIGLSEAREKGDKVPSAPKSSSGRKSARKSTRKTTRKSTRKAASSRSTGTRSKSTRSKATRRKTTRSRASTKRK